MSSLPDLDKSPNRPYRRMTLAALQEYAAIARNVENTTGSLTIAACMIAWGYATTSAAARTMDLLVSAGLVKSYPHGSRNIYRVVDNPPAREFDVEIGAQNE